MVRFIRLNLILLPWWQPCLLNSSEHKNRQAAYYQQYQQPKEKCLHAVYILYFVKSKKPSSVTCSLIQRYHNVEKKCLRLKIYGMCMYPLKNEL